MDNIEIIRLISFAILTLAGILFIVLLSLGIFLIIQIRRYLKKIASGVERAVSGENNSLFRAIGGLLKFPIIGFIIKRLLKRFF